MTDVEDTYHTLSAILFQVGVNNSLKVYAFKYTREKICRVFVPAESIIP